MIFHLDFQSQVSPDVNTEEVIKRLAEEERDPLRHNLLDLKVFDQVVLGVTLDKKLSCSVKIKIG